jgi:hypothetical protein
MSPGCLSLAPRTPLREPLCCRSSRRPVVNVPPWFTAISRPGRVPSTSYDYFAQETVAISDTGMQLVNAYWITGLNDHASGEQGSDGGCNCKAIWEWFREYKDRVETSRTTERRGDSCLSPLYTFGSLCWQISAGQFDHLREIARTSFRAHASVKEYKTGCEVGPESSCPEISVSLRSFMFAGSLRHVLGSREAKRFADESASPLRLYPLRT